MEKVKVVKIDGDTIEFDNGIRLTSSHESDCCESHELSMKDLTMADFEGLQFDLSNDNFFRRIPDYGIELVRIHGHSVKIPGYGYNNGYYSDQLDLVLTNGKDFRKKFDITDCQVIKD